MSLKFKLLILFLVLPKIVFAASCDEIEKKAWKKAYQGAYSEALSLFTEAAYLGSDSAAFFLAHEYKQDGLLSKKNDQLVKEFEDLAKKIRIKENSIYSHTSKFLDDRNVKRILEKSNKIKNLDYARNNSWYHEIYQILKNKTKNIKLRSLTLEASLVEFLKIVMNEEDKVLAQTKYFDLLRLGVEHFGSKEVLEKILDYFVDDYRHIRLKFSSQLLSLVQSKINPQDKNFEAQQLKLKEAYKKLLKSALEYNEFGKSLSYDLLENIILCFYQLDPQLVVEIFKPFVEDKKKYIDTYSISLLMILKKISENSFNECSEEILVKNISEIMRIILENPELDTLFEGTKLSGKSLINRMFEKISNETKDKENDLAFYFFIRDGERYYVEFEELFVNSMPKAILKNKGISADYLCLLDSPHQRIRETAFHVLIASLEQFNDHSLINNIVTGILNNELKYFKERLVQIYQEIYQTLKTKSYHYEIQMLWMFLLQREDQFKNIFLNQIQDYFSIHFMSLSLSNWEMLFNQSLKDKIDNDQISIDFIHSFFENAAQTKFNIFLSKNLIDTFRLKLIFNPQMSLKNQIESFNSHLLNILSQQDQSIFEKFNHLIQSEITHSPFREYINLIFSSLSSDSYVSFAAKKQLKILSKQYPEMKSFHGILSQTTGFVYNAFNDRLYDANQVSQYTSVSSDFIKTTISNTGLIYGFKRAKKDQYHFFACDEKTGDAIWAAPFKNVQIISAYSKQWRDITPNYSFWKENVYLSDSKSIHIFNKDTGQSSGTLHLLNDSSFEFFGITDHGILFSVQKNKIVAYDLNKNLIVFQKEFSDKKDLYSFKVIGNYLAQFERGSSVVSFLKEDGNTFDLETNDSSKEQKSPSNPYWVSRENLFFFGKNTKENSKQIVCFDLDSLKSVWTYNFPDSLENNLFLSNQGDKIFFLTTKNTLFALSTAPNIQESERKLWETSVIGNHGYIPYGHQMTVSPQGHSIYSIEVDYGDLYIIDEISGEQKFKYTVQEGRSRSLLGISKDGKPYIRSINY